MSFSVRQLCLGLFSCAGLLVGGSTARAQANGNGPVNLVLTYSVAASHRTAFRHYWEADGLKALAQWRSDGILSDYHVLFPVFTDEDDPVTLILSFAHFADLGKWQEIEKEHPAGLLAQGLELATPKRADIADVLHTKAAAVPAGVKPVYMLIPYTVTAEPAKYKKYALEYVVPQMEGWIRNGVMSSYGLYLNENPAGAPWSSMLVLEYNGLDGLAQRETLKAKVRGELAADPVWKAWSDDKSSIRTEGHPVIAEELSQ